MNIAFCTPFKPLDHPRTSGDVTIARDLHDFCVEDGHTMTQAPSLQTSWCWQHPSFIFKYHAARNATRILCTEQDAPEAWLTYHSYYKAPDLLGPVAKAIGIPYAIFAGAYAQKRRAPWSTKAGYHLNKRALLAADHVFCNKQRDLEPLLRILPKQKVSMVRPGIRTEKFFFSSEAREAHRSAWNCIGKTVVLTAAMLRPGVKAEGVEHVMTACSALLHSGQDIFLVIAGDGDAREALMQKAATLLPDAHLFLGMVNRWDLHQIYSAADIFAFPGINEGLGMVYLEAQCAGLPVVAWDHDGAPEMVAHGKTGFITPSYDDTAFAKAIGTLSIKKTIRTEMGDAARAHVLANHNIATNYKAVTNKLHALVEEQQN